MDSVILIKGLQLILSLSILVILHEFGHFLPARLFGTRVEKFFLFFDYKFALVKKKIGDTVYGIGWIPLGGYVKISGMIDESMDTEQMHSEPQPWEFRSKPAWQRLIIMLGGIIVNIILAFIIYIMLLAVWGRDYVDPDSVKDGMRIDQKMNYLGFRSGDQIRSIDGKEVAPFDINKHLLLRGVNQVEVKHSDGVVENILIPDSISNYIFKNNIIFNFRSRTLIEGLQEDSAADLAGIKKGDRIININGENVDYGDEARRVIQSVDVNTYPVQLIRSRDTLLVNLAMNAQKQMGVMFAPPNIKIKHKDYSLGESLVGGISYGIWSLHDYVVQLKFLFTKKGAKSIGGLGTIGGLFPEVWDWKQFWERTALLSVILAVMNLLPIPALDGGHVMFLIYEIIARRPPRQKVLEYAQVVGVFIVLALIIYANANDIYKYYIK